MLAENMMMAFNAIRANKLRSVLTMLGIIIGIGSVIAIVSIGDTMRGMFAELYKDVGITQAYVGIGYWVEDVRDSDYFNLDEMERAKEAFSDEIAYIDSNAYTTADAEYKRTSISFDFQGIDSNYKEVQPVNMVYGRYLNEGDVLGRRKNVVMDTDSAKLLFGTENAVGKTFRTTIYGNTDEYTVVGIYRKEVNAFQALMMGGTKDTGSAFLPYTLLTWPNDRFYMLHVFAEEDVDLNRFFEEFKTYTAGLHGREPEDMYIQTAMDEMNSVDSVMGGLSAAVGGIAAISLLVGGIGIMNIMLVSVTERTREIGIRKALGAKERIILTQFVVEAATTSALGGSLGIALGYLVSLGINQILPLFTASLGVEMSVSPSFDAAAVAFMISVGIGVLFGYLPAKRAARLNPIEALRYD